MTDEHRKLAESIHAAWHCAQCRRDGQTEIVELLRKVREEEAKLWAENTPSLNLESNQWKVQRIAALEKP